MPGHGAHLLMNQKAHLHLHLFSSSTTRGNAVTPRGQESAFELTRWPRRSGRAPTSETTPGRRRRRRRAASVGGCKQPGVGGRGRVGGQWRGEGAELYHRMMNVLAQPTPCCSCSLQSLGTSGVGSRDFARVGGGGTPAAASHHRGESRRSLAFRSWMVCACA